jgi:hypothetical protein
MYLGFSDFRCAISHFNAPEREARNLGTPERRTRQSDNPTTSKTCPTPPE